MSGKRSIVTKVVLHLPRAARDVAIGEFVGVDPLEGGPSNLIVERGRGKYFDLVRDVDARGVANHGFGFFLQ
jgi:hypothetical protein